MDQTIAEIGNDVRREMALKVFEEICGGSVYNHQALEVFIEDLKVLYVTMKSKMPRAREVFYAGNAVVVTKSVVSAFEPEVSMHGWTGTVVVGNDDTVDGYVVEWDDRTVNGVMSKTLKNAYDTKHTRRYRLHPSMIELVGMSAR